MDPRQDKTIKEVTFGQGCRTALPQPRGNRLNHLSSDSAGNPLEPRARVQEQDT